jgi:hypothetical protein
VGYKLHFAYAVECYGPSVQRRKQFVVGAALVKVYAMPAVERIWDGAGLQLDRHYENGSRRLFLSNIERTAKFPLDESLFGCR